MSHRHVNLNARRRAVFERDDWRQHAQRKRLMWHGLFLWLGSVERGGGGRIRCAHRELAQPDRSSWGS